MTIEVDVSMGDMGYSVADSAGDASESIPMDAEDSGGVEEVDCSPPETEVRGRD